jgi:protein-S-isoprenylcysteine O-methyltransferase Ste14
VSPRRVNPPHYFALAIAMMIAMVWLPGAEIFAPPWHYTGAVALVCGVAIAMAASRQFAVVGTNIVPLTRSSALVTNGAFAFTRNPMYLGMVTMLLGGAWVLGTATPWLLPPCFAVLIDRRFIRREEGFMAERFGDEYRNFCRRVRRWL